MPGARFFPQIARRLLALTAIGGTPMYTLGAASRATGKSKTTIHRAVKTGRLSASRDDEGIYQIDPAELHRVYPYAPHGNGHLERGATPQPLTVTGDNSISPETVALQRLLRERDEALRDLRARLDSCETERKQLQTTLFALLADQRPTTASPSPTRRWWRFGF